VTISYSRQQNQQGKSLVIKWGGGLRSVGYQSSWWLLTFFMDPTKFGFTFNQS
jgi:hypothetical protein